MCAPKWGRISVCLRKTSRWRQTLLSVMKGATTPDPAHTRTTPHIDPSVRTGYAMHECTPHPGAAGASNGREDGLSPAIANK